MKPKIKFIPIDKLLQDEQNANRGNKRGREALERSLSKYGMGRSVLIDKHGRLIAGNKTVSAAKALGKKQIAVVEIDEDTLVAVQRGDLDLKKDKRAKELAVADNRVGELNLEWDFDVLEGLNIDLGEFWNDKELRELSGEKSVKTIKMLFSAEQIEKQIVADWPSKRTVEQIVADIMCRSMAMSQFNRLASGSGNGSYYISSLFNPHRLSTEARSSETKKNGRTFLHACEDDECKRIGAKWFVRYNHDGVHPYDFVKYSGVGWGGAGQLVYEFRPEIARDLYLKFCKKGAKVLDPCHGWGGRVIGWLAANLGGCYTGFDPAEKTHAGVENLIAFLKQSKTRSRAGVWCMPFENSTLKPNSFDFALTSPPYFDTEQYSKEPTNSLNRFTTLEKWEAGFYKPLILKTLDALKRGSVFVLNVGNKAYPLSDMAQKIAAEQGAECEHLDDHFIGRPEDEEDESNEDFLVIRKV